MKTKATNGFIVCFAIFLIALLFFLVINNKKYTAVDVASNDHISRSSRDENSNSAHGRNSRSSKTDLKYKSREPRKPIESSLQYACRLNNDGTLSVATFENANIPRDKWGEVQSELNTLLERERDLVVKNTTLLSTSESEMIFVVGKFDNDANQEIDDFVDRLSQLSNPESADFIARVIDNSIANFNHGRLEARIVVKLDKNAIGMTHIKHYEVNYYDDRGMIMATSKLGRESFLTKYGEKLTTHLDNSN